MLSTIIFMTFPRQRIINKQLIHHRIHPRVQPAHPPPPSHADNFHYRLSGPLETYAQALL